jgi:hypothetical protein
MSHHHHHHHHHGHDCDHDRDRLRLEAVITSVGFDDLLDLTLTRNHPHLDTAIVVTTHDDRKTQAVAHKHGAICVQTDLFGKNGRVFNKGAAINAGMDRFQFHGWRMHLDADIALPDNFRRVIFNHTHLDPDCLYGADRINVVGKSNIQAATNGAPQYQHRCLVEAGSGGDIGARYVCSLRGYCPLGFFQMWNSRAQKDYPYSLGTAAHDDVMFAAQWSEQHRRHLPSVIVYQLCATEPTWGENWEGRKQPRLG